MNKSLVLLAWRDFWRAPAQVAVTTSILVLGTLGIGLVLFLRGAINAHIDSRATNLLGSDLVITKSVAFDSKEKAIIHQLTSDAGFRVQESYQLFSMVSVEGHEPRLVQLMIWNELPFKGVMKLKNGALLSGEQWDQAVHQQSVFVSSNFADAYKGVNDKLNIGDAQFKVQGEIVEDSTMSYQMAGMAPRIYLPAPFLPSTNLLRMGSTAQYIYSVISVGGDLEALKKNLIKKLQHPAIQVKTAIESGEQSAKAFQMMTDFLGPVSLVGLLICFIGIFYVVTTSLNSKVVELGIFRALGFSVNHILFMFLIQYIFQIVLAASIGIGLLNLCAMGIMKWLILMMPGDWSTSIAISIYLKMILVIALPLVMVAFPYVANLTKQKINHLLSGEIEHRVSWTIYVPAFLTILPLGIWLSYSVKIGFFFFFLVGISFLLLYFALSLLTGQVERYLQRPNTFLSTFWPMILRLILRQKLKLISSVLSISIGVVLLVFIAQTAFLFKAELGGEGRSKVAYFLFDIQEEQLNQLQDFFKEKNVELKHASPMIRGKLLMVNGKPFEKQSTGAVITREDEREAVMRNRGINVSYRSQLNEAEQIVEGRPWSDHLSFKGTNVPLSLEQKYAKTMGIKLGDILRFDIAGIEFDAEVLSLRRVRWTSFYPNFFMIIPPGHIDDAPKTFIGIVDQVDDGRLPPGFFTELNKRFSNVTVLNMKELVKQLVSFIDGIILAISLMSGVVLAVGLLVITSIFYHQYLSLKKDQRYLTLIGMSASQLGLIFSIHLLIILIFAVMMGSFLGLLGSVVLNGLFFHLAWALNIQAIYATIGATLTIWPLLSLVFWPREKAGKDLSLLYS